MRSLKINEHAFVEVEIEGIRWRIVQMSDKTTIKYFSRVGLKYIERETPPVDVKHMWTLLSKDSVGMEQ